MFLFSSQIGAFGNVVPEAMASGVAVVAFDYAATALYVKHQYNGVLMPFGDQQEFICMAVSLAGQPERVCRTGSLAPHSWAAVCNWCPPRVPP